MDSSYDETQNRSISYLSNPMDYAEETRIDNMTPTQNPLFGKDQLTKKMRWRQSLNTPNERYIKKSTLARTRRIFPDSKQNMFNEYSQGSPATPEITQDISNSGNNEEIANSPSKRPTSNFKYGAFFKKVGIIGFQYLLAVSAITYMSYAIVQLNAEINSLNDDVKNLEGSGETCSFSMQHLQNQFIINKRLMQTLIEKTNARMEDRTQTMQTMMEEKTQALKDRIEAEEKLIENTTYYINESKTLKDTYQELHIESEKVRRESQFSLEIFPYNVHPEPVITFYMFTSSKGVVKFTTSDGGSSYTNTGPYYSSGRMHWLGAMNSRGNYITAGLTKNITYIYRLNPSIGQIVPKSVPTKIYACYFFDDNLALCAGLGGEVTGYDFTSGDNPTTIANYFPANTSSPYNFNGLYVTRAKQILLSYQGAFIIKDSAGNNLGASDSGVNNAIAWFSELTTDNLILACQYNVVVLHDIRDLNNIPPPTQLLVFSILRSAHALQIGHNNFAVGGRISNVGYLELYHLEDDFTITPIRFKKFNQISSCVIDLIKEVRIGLLYFGGQCSKMCIWKYAAIPMEEPLCFDDTRSSCSTRDFVFYEPQFYQ